jgi:hypothetical protein
MFQRERAMRQVISELRGLRRRGRLLLVAQRVAALLTAALAVVAGLVLIDWVLRLPATARLVLLLASAGGLSWAVWTRLVPVMRFRPGLTELALRAEGVIPAVAGHLASAVEFAASGVDRSNPLAARSVRETESRLAGESLRRVLSGRRTWRDIGALAAVAAAVGAAVLTSPSAARTGLLRLFAPYGEAQWPARTGVESLMYQVVRAGGVHPRGETLRLRARVTKGQPQRVDALYRLRVEGVFGSWQRAVLTDQGSGVHERLIDVDAEAIVVQFETEDARTTPQRIELIEPPAVERATLEATPPPYAATWFSPVALDLGPGLDQRAVADTPLLAGSEVELELWLNKPLPAPGTEPQAGAILGWDGPDPPGLTVRQAAPDRWTVSFRSDRTRRLEISLADEHGLPNPEPIAYVIPAVEDRPPTVTILDPPSDDAVLATAVVALQVEARDDVAVARVGIEAGVVRAGPAEEETPRSLWQRGQETSGPVQSLRESLHLQEHALSEGDVVILHGVAEDVFELDGARNPAALSAPRRLRIIDAMELAARVRRDLAVVRGNAIRIEAVQEELQDDVIEEGVQPGIDRAQARIGERIAAQREAVTQVGRRIQANQLDDRQLAQLVGQVGDLLDFAGRASAAAVEAIEQSRARRPQAAPLRGGSDERAARERGGERARPGGTERAAEDAPQGQPRPLPSPGTEDEPADLPAEAAEPAEADRPIVEAQQEVREELADLIALLDRDEDAWVATRWLEDIRDAQAALQREAGELDRRTVGRELEELAPQEQGELQRIAERQSDLSAQARQLLEDLRARAKELRGVDPGSAAGLREAAQTGERRELVKEMETAAERLSQNQMRTARQAQGAAGSALERMLQDLRDVSRADVRELLRRLLSLIESVQRLVTVQEGEIALLAAARQDGRYAGRDRAMIRLNQNTQAVADEARMAGQEVRRVARVLDRAADAQGASVVALRADPVSAGEAQDAEARSLEQLQEALALAQELARNAQERELLQRREEVIAAYRRFVEQEVELRGRTEELARERPLDRRGLQGARGLGASQEEIRTGLDDLRRGTDEVSDSAVFSRVHELVDGWARQVSEALEAGEVGTTTTDRQGRIADSIGRLVEALEITIKPPDEFGGEQRGGTGQGGHGGQQPLIPPIAELKLLRGMQEGVYNLTREIDGRTDLDPAERELRLTELGRDQRSLHDLGRQILDALRRSGSGE